MLNKTDLNQSAQEIIGWLISPKYLLPNGMISRKIINTRASEIHILPDLGDYLPFFLVFGHQKFCQNHLENIIRIAPDGILSSQIKKKGLWVITSYEHSDFLLGLIDYFNLTKDQKYEDYLIKAAKNVIKIFKIGNLSNSYYFPQIKFSLPICDTRDGMFIEIFNELGNLDPKYKDKKIEIFNSFINDDFFKKHSIFSEFIVHNPIILSLSKLSPYLIRRLNRVVVMKNNTNTLFSFIDLYRKEKSEVVFNAIIKLMNGIKNQFLVGDALSLFKDKVSEKPKEENINLTANFSFIDALCDIAYFLNYPEAKELAIRISDYWLNLQSNNTGLFPISPLTEKDDLDNQTDMIIALVKLSEITGEKKYYQAASKCLKGVLKYHHADQGYYLSVSIKNGEVIDNSYKTKFISLFLKALYLFKQDDQIYNNNQLFELLKDR